MDKTFSPTKEDAMATTKNLGPMVIYRHGVRLGRTIGGWVFDVGNPLRRYRIEKYQRGWWNYCLKDSREMTIAQARTMAQLVEVAVTIPENEEGK
jgi:hypothetical protein